MKCPIRMFSVGVVLACALAGCAQSPAGSESSAPSSAPEAPVSSEAANGRESPGGDIVSSRGATSSAQAIILSDYDGGKNLKVNIAFPEGWSVEKRVDRVTWVKYPLQDMNSIVNIYNDQKEYVGAMGCAAYKEYEGNEELPQAIYSGIAIGNNYKFDAQPVSKGGYYTPVQDTDTGETAITKVYYMPNISQDVGYGNREVWNKGILSYDRDLLAYIAIEFDDNSMSDEDLIAIAKSIVMAPASTPEVTQNPETGDSLGNPSFAPPPSWDQPGPDAEKEVLALAREHLLALPSRDSNVESVAIEGESLHWNLKAPDGPVATIEFIAVTVGRADSTSLQYPAGESKPCVYEEYRLLSSGWEFLGDGIAFQNVSASNPLT